MHQLIYTISEFLKREDERDNSFRYLLGYRFPVECYKLEVLTKHLEGEKEDPKIVMGEDVVGYRGRSIRYVKKEFKSDLSKEWAVIIMIPNVEKGDTQEEYDKNERHWKEMAEFYEVEYNAIVYVFRPPDVNASLLSNLFFYQFILDFVSSVKFTLEVDPVRIVLMGHGVGGNFCFNTAYLAPQLFSGVFGRDVDLNALPPMETFANIKVGFKAAYVSDDDPKLDELREYSRKYERFSKDGLFYAPYPSFFEYFKKESKYYILMMLCEQETRKFCPDKIVWKGNPSHHALLMSNPEIGCYWLALPEGQIKENFLINAYINEEKDTIFIHSDDVDELVVRVSEFLIGDYRKVIKIKFNDVLCFEGKVACHEKYVKKSLCPCPDPYTMYFGEVTVHRPQKVHGV